MCWKLFVDSVQLEPEADEPKQLETARMYILFPDITFYEVELVAYSSVVLVRET